MKLLTQLSFCILLITSIQLCAQNSGNPLTVQEPFAIQDLLAQFSDENAKRRNLAGFRVQIYNGGKKEAQDVRVSFLKVYQNSEVALTYETPEYKVQVGNFRSRVEAEALLVEIRKDFKGCFVVKTNIELPALP